MKKVIILISVLFVINVSLLGCAVFRGEPGPKLYDNATLEIISDNALLLPQMADKDFMQIVRTRLSEFTEAEIETQGNLKVVSSCGDRTIKFTQDIASIVVNSVTDVRGGFFLFQLFSLSSTATKKDDITISINTSVVDCRSGKKLGSTSYQRNGQNPIDILKTLASWNVQYTYGYQHGPRPDVR